MDNQNELDSLFSQPIEQDIDLEAGKLLDTIDFNFFCLSLSKELANLAEEEFNVETSNFHAPTVPTHSIPNRQSELDQYGRPKIAIRD